MKGSNNYYKSEMKKLEMKVRFLEEKAEDGETALAAMAREKERLEVEVRNVNKTVFEHSHLILRLEGENKKLQEHCEEMEFDCNQKDIYGREAQGKLDALISERERELYNYNATISKLEGQIKYLTLKGAEEVKELKGQWESESEGRVGALVKLERELKGVKESEVNMKEKLTAKEQREADL
jgi:chromosome segregation ATPase